MPESRKKILYTAISQGHLHVFHRPSMKLLHELGYEVFAIGNVSPSFNLVEAHHTSDVKFHRSPFSLGNMKAFFRLVKFIRKESFTMVHCHTPVASVLTRLAVLFAKGPKPVTLYTAHGFHFYEGAPVINWLLWFPLEWLLARITDITVVINKWDQTVAVKRLLSNNVHIIPGMGVDLDRFSPIDSNKRDHIRLRENIPSDAFVIIYVAEHIPRKNHDFIFRSFSKIIDQIPSVILLCVGDGPLVQANEKKCSQLNIDTYVRFLGFRNDVQDLCAAADLAISASRQEGLPIGVLEAMASGLPVVVSNDRGHRELVAHGENGWIYPQDNEELFIQHVIDLAKDPILRKRFGQAGRVRSALFSTERSIDELKKVYSSAESIVQKRSLKNA